MLLTLVGATPLRAAPADGGPSAERGQAFFKKNFGRDMGFSCSSCHTENPLRNGKDQVTEKNIRPRSEIYNMAYKYPENQEELGAKLVAEYKIQSLTNCSVCHR